MQKDNRSKLGNDTGAGTAKHSSKVQIVSTDSSWNGDPAILEEVLYRIEAKGMLFIEGAFGSGKTTLLKVAIENFRGRIIYVDCGQMSRRLNIEELLQGKYGLVKGRLLGLKPKHMILMLDNVDKLSKINTERLKYYFDHDYLHAVVFTGEDIAKAPFTPSMLHRIGRRIVRIPASPFGHKEADAASSPAPFDSSVSDACSSCGTALVTIGYYARCEKCDVCCSACGALVGDVHATRCPCCDVEFEETHGQDAAPSRAQRSAQPS